MLVHIYLYIYVAQPTLKGLWSYLSPCACERVTQPTERCVIVLTG